MTLLIARSLGSLLFAASRSLQLFFGRSNHWREIRDQSNRAMLFRGNIKIRVTAKAACSTESSVIPNTYRVPCFQPYHYKLLSEMSRNGFRPASQQFRAGIAQSRRSSFVLHLHHLVAHTSVRALSSRILADQIGSLKTCQIFHGP